MDNIFFTLTGIMAALLFLVSFGRQVSWKFDNAGVTILQFGLTAETLLLFHYGLLWEVIR